MKARLRPVAGAPINASFGLEPFEVRSGEVNEFWPVDNETVFRGSASFLSPRHIVLGINLHAAFADRPPPRGSANVSRDPFHAPLPPFVAGDGAAKRAIVLGARPSETSQWTFAAYNTGSKQMRIRVIIRRADGTAIFVRTRTVGATRLKLIPFTAATVGPGIWADVRVLTPATFDRRVLPFFLESKDTGEQNIYRGQVVR